MDKDRKRGERMDSSMTAAMAAYRIVKRRDRNWSEGRTVAFYRKNGVQTHSCSKKQHGKPKLCHGICFKGTSGRVDPSWRGRGKYSMRVNVKRRLQWRAERTAWLRDLDLSQM